MSIQNKNKNVVINLFDWGYISHLWQRKWTVRIVWLIEKDYTVYLIAIYIHVRAWGACRLEPWSLETRARWHQRAVQFKSTFSTSSQTFAPACEAVKYALECNCIYHLYAISWSPHNALWCLQLTRKAADDASGGGYGGYASSCWNGGMLPARLMAKGKY